MDSGKPETCVGEKSTALDTNRFLKQKRKTSAKTGKEAERMNGKELNLNEMESVSGGNLADMAFITLMITLGLITAEEEKPGGASGGW